MVTVVVTVAAGLTLGSFVTTCVTTLGAGGVASPGPKRQATKNSTPIATTAISATSTALEDSRALGHRPLAPPAEQLVVVPRAEARGVLVDEQPPVQAEVARIGAQEPAHIRARPPPARQNLLGFRAAWPVADCRHDQFGGETRRQFGHHCRRWNQASVFSTPAHRRRCDGESDGCSRSATGEVATATKGGVHRTRQVSGARLRAVAAS